MLRIWGSLHARRPSYCLLSHIGKSRLGRLHYFLFLRLCMQLGQTCICRPEATIHLIELSAMVMLLLLLFVTGSLLELWNHVLLDLWGGSSMRVQSRSVAEHLLRWSLVRWLLIMALIVITRHCSLVVLAYGGIVARELSKVSNTRLIAAGWASLVGETLPNEVIWLGLAQTSCFCQIWPFLFHRFVKHGLVERFLGLLCLVSRRQSLLFLVYCWGQSSANVKLFEQRFMLFVKITEEFRCRVRYFTRSHLIMLLGLLCLTSELRILCIQSVLTLRRV